MKDAMVFLTICTIVALVLFNLIFLLPYPVQTDSHGTYYRIITGTVVF